VKSRSAETVEIQGRSLGKQTSAEPAGEDRTGERQGANRRRRGRTSRLLPKHNIKPVGLAPKRIPSFLRSVSDDVGLKTPGVYSDPCVCGQVYIGQTGRSIETRIKEHHRHIRLEQPDKSALAEDSINRGHRIKLQDTVILCTRATYIDRMIREVTEVNSYQSARRYKPEGSHLDSHCRGNLKSYVNGIRW
jgi:hypothetical protein